ncbi:MAG: hemagglutinin [Symploca sp. SIO2G7]|nr:hemagglutinin [Symploca sp. SIO2G7]
MSEEQLRQLITSNAKAISALTNLANEVIPRMDEMQRQINNMQRDSIETKRYIDDTTADIRELMLENQRILRYLENIVNREN